MPPTPTPTPTDSPTPAEIAYSHTRFAVIGDYGTNDRAEKDVAELVHSWHPDFILTVGDNNLPIGAWETIDQNIGQHYHDFIYPYTGEFGAGASTLRYFPILGNHDWDTDSAQPYLDYFQLPGNERYYDFTWGPVQFYALDSDPREPDGTKDDSIQANWLQEALGVSQAPWKIVYLHHAPYTSSVVEPSSLWMRWPYAVWGADAVLAGHIHSYERFEVDGIPYFVNGLGGQDIFQFGTPLPESQVRYEADYGAMLVDATAAQITFQFINRTGQVVDIFVLTKN